MAKPKENPSKAEEEEEEVEDIVADSNSKKKKKKKKEKQQTIKIETISENPNKFAPIIGYFPSGYNPFKNNNGDKLEKSAKSITATTNLYRNVKRNNRLQVVVSPNGSSSKVDFVGTNYSGEATAAQLCSYSLGVLDKETQTLRIVPIAANKIIRLEPRVRGSEVPELEDPDAVKQDLTAEERADQLNRLTLSYSSKKNIREARKRDSLRLQEDTGTQEEFDKNMDGAINKEALQEAVGTDNVRNIPPHDLAATDPQLAYPLDRIIFEGDWNYLLDVLELTKSGGEMTPDVYPSFVCNRSYKLEQIQDEYEKNRLAVIFSYITHLIKFKDRHSMDGVSSAKHHKMPGYFFRKFSSMFDVTDSKRLPDDKRQLLISYVLVLTLFVDDFRSDPSDIAKDLRVNAVALRPHYQNLGCKFVREKNVALATLPLPLKFPSITRKRRR